jgi:cytochrome c-type biogenesis protein CcmH/NrfG
VRYLPRVTSRALRLPALLLPAALGLVAAPPSWAQATKLAGLRAEAKAKPKEPAVAFALGRALRRAGLHAEAKGELQRAAALSTGEPAIRARYELAQVEIESAKPNPASPSPPSLSSCKSLKGSTLAEAFGRLCAAEAWLRMERFSIAEAELAAAEKLEPALYELSLLRAAVAFGKGDGDGAASQLRALTERASSRPEAFALLGRVLVENGRGSDAVAPLRKARALDDGDPETTLLLARALPEGAEARELARGAVAMRASFPAAQLRLGQIELALGAPDAARIAFEASLKDAPKVLAAQVGLAAAWVATKRWPEAQKAANEAVALSASDPGARLILAEALAGGGATDDAVEAFKLAHGLDGTNPRPLVRAAEVLLAAREPMKASAHAEAAVRAFPDDAQAWLVLGDVEFATGDKKGARDAWTKALSAPKGTIDRAAVQKRLAGAK